jgi:hypothetical protein
VSFHAYAVGIKMERDGESGWRLVMRHHPKAGRQPSVFGEFPTLSAAKSALDEAQTIVALIRTMGVLDAFTHAFMTSGRKIHSNYACDARPSPLKRSDGVLLSDPGMPITCPACAVIADAWQERGMRGMPTVRRVRALRREIARDPRSPSVKRIGIQERIAAKRARAGTP